MHTLWVNINTLWKMLPRSVAEQVEENTGRLCRQVFTLSVFLLLCSLHGNIVPDVARDIARESSRSSALVASA